MGFCCSVPDSDYNNPEFDEQFNQGITMISRPIPENEFNTK